MGLRAYKTAAYTGAVSFTFSPYPDKTSKADQDQGFTLVDLALDYSVAPTTSENIVVTSTFNSVVYQEHAFDPSTSTDLTSLFRFDKRFPKGTTITMTFTNTDAAAITARCLFELDDNVA
jgi:hypothetical protein